MWRCVSIIHDVMKQCGGIMTLSHCLRWMVNRVEGPVLCDSTTEMLRMR